jgi:hypothetical protein
MIDRDISNAETRKKRPGWTRTVDLVLRTAHVAVTSVLFGGAVLGVPLSGLFSWRYLAVGTGCGLIASEVYHSRHWLYQGRGVLALVHFGLLGLIYLRHDLLVPILTVVLVFGMVGSHMPKKLRHWSFVHGRVMAPE